jgi:hypothetical protein
VSSFFRRWSVFSKRQQTSNWTSNQRPSACEAGRIGVDLRLMCVCASYAAHRVALTYSVDAVIGHKPDKVLALPTRYFLAAVSSWTSNVGAPGSRYPDAQHRICHRLDILDVQAGIGARTGHQWAGSGCDPGRGRRRPRAPQAAEAAGRDSGSGWPDDGHGGGPSQATAAGLLYAAKMSVPRSRTDYQPATRVGP